jgi:beta-mannosidase
VLPRMVRFVGEFGAQAVPSADEEGDGAAFCEPDRWPDLDWERLGERHNLQKARFDRYVPAAAFASFDDWRQATQRYQAELIRRHVEVLRRLKYRPTGGFAQFCLADGHPGVTWSVLDHQRRPKLGYEALRDACRPVIVVADRLPATVAPGEALALDVHVVSDLRAAVDDARVTARLEWPGGHHEWRWGGDIPADECVRVGTLQAVVPEAEGPLCLDLGLHLSPPGCRRQPLRVDDRHALILTASACAGCRARTRRPGQSPRPEPRATRHRHPPGPSGRHGSCRR